MKKLVLFSPLLCAFAFIGIQSWNLADGYSVKFTSPDVSGTFKSMKADIRFDPNDVAHALFDVKIAVSSLETGNPGMNGSATGEDMLDGAKYPEIRFHSSKVEKKDTAFVTRGVLEVHGVKKEISIPFSFRNKTFTGKFAIACSAYGMKGAGKGASDTVKIDLAVPVKE
jgi:polyisoprenoid-binding protein YceI